MIRAFLIVLNMGRDANTVLLVDSRDPLLKRETRYLFLSFSPCIIWNLKLAVEKPSKCLIRGILWQNG